MNDRQQRAGLPTMPGEEEEEEMTVW